MLYFTSNIDYGKLNNYKYSGIPISRTLISSLSSIKHCNFTPQCLEVSQFEPILVSLGGSKDRDSTVWSKCCHGNILVDKKDKMSTVKFWNKVQNWILIRLMICKVSFIFRLKFSHFSAVRKLLLRRIHNIFREKVKKQYVLQHILSPLCYVQSLDGGPTEHSWYALLANSARWGATVGGLKDPLEMAQLHQIISFIFSRKILFIRA